MQCVLDGLCHGSGVLKQLTTTRCTSKGRLYCWHTQSFRQTLSSNLLLSPGLLWGTLCLGGGMACWWLSCCLGSCGCLSWQFCTWPLRWARNCS